MQWLLWRFFVCISQIDTDDCRLALLLLLLLLRLLFFLIYLFFFMSARSFLARLSHLNSFLFIPFVWWVNVYACIFCAYLFYCMFSLKTYLLFAHKHVHGCYYNVLCPSSIWFEFFVAVIALSFLLSFFVAILWVYLQFFFFKFINMLKLLLLLLHDRLVNVM